ncbi:hypothetical protein KIN20_025530, partial [Parelaphostrongylus tenuis]
INRWRKIAQRNVQQFSKQMESERLRREHCDAIRNLGIIWKLEHSEKTKGFEKGETAKTLVIANTRYNNDLMLWQEENTNLVINIGVNRKSASYWIYRFLQRSFAITWEPFNSAILQEDSTRPALYDTDEKGVSSGSRNAAHIAQRPLGQ